MDYGREVSGICIHMYFLIWSIGIFLSCINFKSLTLGVGVSFHDQKWLGMHGKAFQKEEWWWGGGCHLWMTPDLSRPICLLFVGADGSFRRPKSILGRSPLALFICFLLIKCFISEHIG